QQAQLQLGELKLYGPAVTINQEDNTAEVEGVGAMSMPSNSTFDGGKAKPGTRLTVYWNKNMLFDGKFAFFKGGVQAQQDSGKLLCMALQVELDREVSFREGQKGGQSAKVKKLVCDQKVSIVDEVQNDGKLEKYQSLIATYLIVDNQDGPTNATGPGRVEILGMGTDEMPDPNARPAAPGQAKVAQLMLTRIEYESRMSSNSKDNTRTSRFYDNVHVFHKPSARPNIRMDPDNMGKDGFWLRSDLLTVYTRVLTDGRNSQEMWATG